MPRGLSASAEEPFLEGAARQLDRRLLQDDPAPVAVAFSGGGDSLALLRLATAWGARARRPVLALTVDHGLGPLSEGWTRFAEGRARDRGAAFRALRWEGVKPTRGLQAAARAARHALLAQAAREAGAAVILLGHTADDVEETESMRAGDTPGIGRLRAWSPSPAWPHGRGVMLLRPLIGLRREALRGWLRADGQTWIDDPANDDDGYARVRARKAGPKMNPVSPLDEDAVASLARIGVSDPGDGGLALDPAALAQAGEGAARRVLSAAVVCAGGGSAIPRAHQIDGLRRRLSRGEPAVAQLAGARIESSCGRVILRREPGDARRNARPDVDGVADGLFEHGRPLVYERFRAATFQLTDEAQLRTTSST